jgi:hypothetical protein
VAQERLFAAAREHLGGLVLTHLHHLLKVMRYRFVVEGLFVSISTSDWPKTFPSDVGTAMHFPKALLRNEAASKMGEQGAALFFARQNSLGVLAALEGAKKAFEAACEEARSGKGKPRPLERPSQMPVWPEQPSSGRLQRLTRRCLPPTGSLSSESASIS